MEAKILLVEDDPNSALLVKDFLTLKGFAIDHVKDGITAVERIEDAYYNLVILDLRLPGQNGFVTAEKIRQSAAGASLPIVVLTAFADTQNKLRAYHCGANFVLPKPVNIKELYYIVKNLIELRVHSTIENADKIWDSKSQE